MQKANTSCEFPFIGSIQFPARRIGVRGVGDGEAASAQLHSFGLLGWQLWLSFLRTIQSANGRRLMQFGPGPFQHEKSLVWTLQVPCGFSSVLNL
ncbi:hypothetical protein LSTR_LSTR007015 [Laodelphax striatellus]|uniref:Uncharacterized protein n=1 Tax=Laodelphax striatellus TaxID=195883 RepID=A0A482WJD4_LAOST|nr:hypothetical protein LSTR_LSTR007015 [Laodelphax striatellus]